MAQYNIYLNEQERTKINLIKINFNLKSNQEVFKFLIAEYKIKVDDRGFSK